MCRTKPQNIKQKGANTVGEASGSQQQVPPQSDKPQTSADGSYAIMQAMEAFLSDADSDMSLSNMTFNSQGSYMVTSSNEPPLDTSIRVNDDFDISIV